MASGSKRRRASSCGFTLMEVLIAIIVLSIGMLGGAVMIMTAIATNNRAKLDTSATMLAQNVMELVLASGANSTATLTITDCTGAVFNVNTAGAAAPGAGAPLSGTSIDFSQAQVAGYGMNYTVCRANGDQVIYDVRWNNQNFRTSGTVVFDKMITVAARPTGAGQASSASLRNFALPVSLVGMAGN